MAKSQTKTYNILPPYSNEGMNTMINQQYSTNSKIARNLSLKKDHIYKFHGKQLKRIKHEDLIYSSQ